MVYHITTACADVKSAGGLIKSEAYIDTVEVYFRWLPNGIRRLQHLQGHNRRRRIIIEKCKDRHNKIVGHRVILHQPKPETLTALDRFQTQYHGVLCRFDVAPDFLFATESEAERFGRWLVRHTVLKWRRPGPMLDFPGGIIWIPHRDRKRTPNRNLSVYWDRPSKLDKTRFCVHPELRFQRAEACRKEGINRVNDLEKINPAALFRKHLALSDAGEEFATHVIREAVDTDRDRAKRRKPRTPFLDSFTDRYRASISRFAATVLRKSGRDRAQSVKDTSKRITMTQFDLDLPSTISPLP
jgi:hypothetical protein